MRMKLQAADRASLAHPDEREWSLAPVTASVAAKAGMRVAIPDGDAKNNKQSRLRQAAPDRSRPRTRKDFSRPL